MCQNYDSLLQNESAEVQTAIGFKGDLIHTFNKNQSSIDNHDYFEHLRARNNVILLGDSLGDLDMAEGVKEVNALLKIGFLNHKVSQCELLFTYFINCLTLRRKAKAQLL